MHSTISIQNGGVVPKGHYLGRMQSALAKKETEAVTKREPLPTPQRGRTAADEASRPSSIDYGKPKARR
jgi:hypothetical protein